MTLDTFCVCTHTHTHTHTHTYTYTHTCVGGVDRPVRGLNGLSVGREVAASQRYGEQSQEVSGGRTEISALIGLLCLGSDM